MKIKSLTHTRSRTRIAWFSGGLLLLLTGCTVGPDLQKPDPPASTAFSEAREPASPEPLEARWWTRFHDPRLDELMEELHSGSPGISAAIARTDAARAVLGIERGHFFPSASTRGSAGYSWDEMDSDGEIYRGSGGLDYLVDVWGRVRRGVEAAGADYHASEADLAAVRLSLQADLARHYIRLRGTDEEIALLDRTVETRREAQQLIERRLRAGDASELTNEQARAELETARAEAIALRRERGHLEHAIAVLVGKEPAQFAIAPETGAFGTVAEIPVAVPSTILRRRPDVARAEARLRAANARIGEATAALFPEIRLSAEAGRVRFGGSSPQDDGVTFGFLGAGLRLPLFEGGALHSEVRQRAAETEEMTAAYRATVLRAFREVEDALLDLHVIADQLEAQLAAADAANRATDLSETRYNHGLVDYLEVIDSERTRLAAERSLVRLHRAQLTATVDLAQAVGGGVTSL